jgi:PadR family transcriptional regulator PadR
MFMTPVASGAAADAGLPTSGDRAPKALPARLETRIAWILLLLGSRAMHGYALIRELEANGVSIDPPSMYRTLRKLEDDGWVSSSWSQSEIGPRRRAYRVTAAGRQGLRDMAAMIAASRDAHDRFLEGYESAAYGQVGLLAAVPEDVVHPGLLGGWWLRSPSTDQTPDEMFADPAEGSSNRGQG